MGAAAWRPMRRWRWALRPIVAWRRQSRIERFSIQTILGVEIIAPIGGVISDVDFSQFSL